MYRRFGLFNEKLDQFPTFLGIEPPDLFDKDHLLLTRTTYFAGHGAKQFGDYTASYFLTTGIDRRGSGGGRLPGGMGFPSVGPGGCCGRYSVLH